MGDLWAGAFARHDRATLKRREFGQCWASYISVHPWSIDVRSVDPHTLEILAVMREPAPVELALIFSEWLAALRGALDNGLYALAAAISGQGPPPQAERIQFPICSSPEDFRKQSERLSMLPTHVVEALEKGQPYQSPFGPESNLTYWVLADIGGAGTDIGPAIPAASDAPVRAVLEPLLTAGRTVVLDGNFNNAVQARAIVDFLAGTPLVRTLSVAM